MPIKFPGIWPDRQSFLKSLVSALRGIAYIFKTQRSFRIQVFLGICAIFLGIIFKLPHVDFFLLLIFIVIVLLAEIANTALETTLDLVTKKLRYKVKVAKDVAAGGVLLVSIFSLIFGIFIFGKRILFLLKEFKCW